MSNTRNASPGADPDASPERHLSATKLKGINIGMNIVCRVARVRPEPERRAMIWLTNYALLHHLTADEVSAQVDLSREEIRSALTDPEADLARFVRQVRTLRATFEASLPELVPTAVTKTVREAVRFAVKNRKLVECIAKTRQGKTVSARPEFYRLLDRATWLSCPTDDSERTFIFDLARALGISVGGGKKAVQVRPQVTACFGPGLIDVLFVDEGHFLWPVDPRTKPKRVEFLRNEINADGTRASVLVFATPQHTNALNAALDLSGRWAPGQWDGRVVRFYCDDAMSEQDLAAVARHHCPEATANMVQDLVMQAMATEGYCGTMVSTIELARFFAGDGKPVAQAHLDRAQKQMARGTRLDQIATVVNTPKKRRAA